MRDSSGNLVNYSPPAGVNNVPSKNNNDLYLLESMFDHLTIGLYRTSVDGTILYSNDAVVRLLGYDSLEDLQKRDLEKEGYGQNSSRESFKKILEEKGEVIGLESCWKRKDGTEIYVRENARVVKNDDGGICYFEGTIEDITEKKKIEIELAKSEERFRNLYENATVGLYRSTPDCKLLMANPALVAIYGYSNFEELANVPAEDIYFDPSDRNKFKEILEREGTIYGYESIGKKPDGSKFYFLDSARVVKDKDGKILYYDGVIQDVTEQKKAEDEIQNQNVFLKNVFESLTHPFYVVDAADHNVIMGNSMSGFNSNGERPSCFGITHHLDRPCNGEADLCPLEIVKKTKKPTTVEHIHFNENGDEIIVEVHGYPIFDDHGNVKQMIEYCLDITERKMAEKDLQDIQSKLTTILNNVPVGVYRSTPDGQVLSSNPSLVRMLGYDTKEEYNSIPGENSYLNKKRRAEFIEELMRKGDVKNFESQMIRKDGTIIWVSANATATKDDKGNILYIDGSEEDITERKKTQMKLEESEKEFRSLIEQAPDGIFRLDSQGNFILANKISCELLGYTEEEILQMNIKDTYSTKNEEENAFSRMEELETGENAVFERMLKRKDGKIIIVEVYVTRLWDNSFQEIVHDITERKRKELLQNAVYQISEATDKAKSLDDLYKSVHEIIDSVLPAKNFFISLYNKKEDLLTFPYYVDEIDSPPGPIKAGKGYTAYVLRTGKSVFYDEELDKRLKENGEVESVGTDSPSWLGVPLIIDAEIIGAMVVQHYSDPNAYTESDLQLLEYVSSQIAKAIVSKRAEEELRKLSSAVKQSSASIVITDTHGNIEYVNPKFTEFTGFTEDEVKGKNTRIMKSGQTPREVYDDLWATIKSGQSWKGELHNKKKNGELYWESASISPIRDTDGKITHFLAVKEDITERMRIQKELIESKEKAEQMNRLKSTFLANMSHELRTPLVGILGYAEIIHSEITDPDQKDMTGTIISSGKRLMNTLNSILDLSKVEAEKNELKLIPVEILSIVKESIKLFKVEANKKNLKLECLTDDENLVSPLDESLLKQILDNLLSNAIKYTETGSIKVSIDTDRKMNRAVLKVVDSGIGISVEHQKVIFEEFRQVSEGLNRQYEGTGLGLTITKKFVELMNGDINLESELGKGSKFTLTFPLVEDITSNIDIADAG